MKRIITLGMALVMLLVSLSGCFFVPYEGHERGKGHDRGPEKGGGHDGRR